MKQFYQEIDKRSREAMTAYLENHFRYATANSWNQSYSYACNLKIHNLGLSREHTEKLYGLIQTDDFHDHLQELRDDFGADHGYLWQAGLNGRSGGYLVLYQGDRVPNGYKSFCTRCGQRNYQSTAQNGSVCGVCRHETRRDYPEIHKQTITYPGRGTDQNQDYEDWSMYELRSRVELVSEFDKLADALVAEAVYLAENYSVREEAYTVMKTRLVMAECAV